MPFYKVWTDGSIQRNPKGPGAAASLIENKDGGQRLLVSRRDGDTTSNREEMHALIQILEYVKWPSSFKVYSDSEYLVLGVNERLIYWLNNDMKTKAGTEVSNRDLWERIAELLEERHMVQMEWVMSHNGDHNNDLVDKLAHDYCKNPELFKDVNFYDGRKLVKIEKKT